MSRAPDAARAEALKQAVESLKPLGDTQLILARAAAFEAYLRGGLSGSGKPSEAAEGDGAA